MERSAHNVESAGSSPPCKDLELKVTNNIVLRPCLLGRLQYRSVCNSERRHDQLQSVNVSSTHAVVWHAVCGRVLPRVYYYSPRSDYQVLSIERQRPTTLVRPLLEGPNNAVMAAEKVPIPNSSQCKANAVTNRIPCLTYSYR